MPQKTLVKKKVDKALEWFAANPFLTFKEVNDALGGNYCSQWYYANTHGFRDRYDAILQQAFAELEAPAIMGMKDLIEQRNFQACKYVLDNRGYKAVEKVEANIKNDINITIEE